VYVGQITRRGAHPPPGLFRAYTLLWRASRNARKTSRKGMPGKALGPVEYAYEKCSCSISSLPCVTVPLDSARLRTLSLRRREARLHV
jgi:hypothetical protein